MALTWTLHANKTDNADTFNKVKLREKAIEGLESVRVLDLFAGENVLWSQINKDDYFGVEREEGKGNNDFYGDNMKIIPVLDLKRFNVIDVDSWGVPYPQIKALFENKTLQKGTVIIYTAIGSKMSYPNRECMIDYGVLEMWNKAHTLFNKLTIPWFYDLLYRNGVRKVWEFEDTETSFDKHYGYFLV